MVKQLLVITLLKKKDKLLCHEGQLLCIRHLQASQFQIAVICLNYT